MDKFSLYDFLGLLLPGVIFIFISNTLYEFYGIYPELLETLNWEIHISIALCFAIIIGALFFASNFYLAKKVKWFNRFFGMYKHVAELYLQMPFLHKLMNQTLNKKANEWYQKDVFFEKNDFDKLDEETKNEINDLQEEYYDRMYYELEYHDKIENSKTVQSFYFFFRQTALAFILLLLFVAVLSILQLFSCLHLSSPDSFKIIWFAIFLVSMLFISVKLAKWYRERMVMKMYWAYFTHLNQI